MVYEPGERLATMNGQGVVRVYQVAESGELVPVYGPPIAWGRALRMEPPERPPTVPPGPSTHTG